MSTSRFARGEILGLIGPNGAGKTTLVNVLAGFQRATTGAVVLDGEDITTWAPAEIARGGTRADVPGRPPLSGAHRLRERRSGRGLDRCIAAAGPCARPGRSWPGSLSSRKAGLTAGGLPHGEERRLAIARALALRPLFLLLDEPAAGLNEGESDELVGRSLRSGTRSHSDCS